MSQSNEIAIRKPQKFNAGYKDAIKMRWKLVIRFTLNLLKRL